MNPTFMALSLLLALACAGCERAGSTPENPATGSPAREAAGSYFQALQYGDSARAFTSHLDATPLGTWCGSRAFRELLQKLRAGKNEQECERARALTDARPEELDDDAMMMLQTMRFVCEQPQGRCHDYARKVFTSRMQGLEVERGALKSWRVTKELPGEGAEQVVLYVDLEYEKTGKKRAVMTMRQTPLGWRVSNEPGEL